MLLPQISLAAPRVTLARPVSVGSGFAPGTAIETEDGPLPVEHLFAGDRVAVQGGGFATLRSVTRVRALAAEVVVLTPGTAEGLDRPLVLPAAHPVVVADWRTQVLFGKARVLAPAATLVDGVAARRERREVQVLLRLEFDRPQVIRANGMWLGCGTERAARPARKLH